MLRSNGTGKPSRLVLCPVWFQASDGPNQLGSIIQLHQVMVDAQRAGPVQIGIIAARAQNHYIIGTKVSVQPQPFEHFKSIHDRHFQVQQQQRWAAIRSGAAQELDSSQAVTYKFNWNVIGGFLKGTTKQDLVIGIVFSDEN